LGALDFSLLVSYEKILTDHEFLGMVERLAKGVEVSDETLAVDVIDKVGPGGNFLAQKHTREHHRKEHFIPALFDTRPHESWFKAGAKQIMEIAREEVKRILKNTSLHPSIET